MGYIDKIVSAHSDEKTFLKKLIHEIINNGQGKITCNRTDTDIDTAYETTRVPVDFNILNTFTFRINPNPSLAADVISFPCQVFLTAEPTNIFCDLNQFFYSRSYYDPKYATDILPRKYPLKIIIGQNFVFFQLLRIGCFFYKTNNETIISWQVNDASNDNASGIQYSNLTPLQTMGIRMRSAGETSWRANLSEKNRLSYKYDAANSNQLELVAEKTFIQPVSSSSDIPIKGVSLNGVYDCSYYPSIHSILVFNNEQYFVIDNYTLLKIYNSST